MGNVFKNGSTFTYYWNTVTSSVKFDRPNLTSNTSSAVMKIYPVEGSGSHFWSWHSNDGKKCYLAFDGDTSTYVQSYKDGGGLTGADLKIYFDKAIKLSSVRVRFKRIENNPGYYGFIVYRSNSSAAKTKQVGKVDTAYQDSTTVSIDCNSDAASNYWRLNINCPGNSSQDEIQIVEINFYTSETFTNLVSSTATHSSTTTHDWHQLITDGTTKKILN